MPFITFHIKYRVANEVATARCHKTFFLPQKFQYLHREKEKKSEAQFSQYCTMYGQIKMSHSIHILSIQIDTKRLELSIYHQFNNIKLSFFASPIFASFK